MPASTLQMRVHKYIPDRLYGFAVDDQGQEVFFHLGAFGPGTDFGPPEGCGSCPDTGCSWVDAPPPPILGESVEVTVDLSSQDGRAPRAERVRRLLTPRVIRGEVETFDPLRGYGFVVGVDGISYHLHRSEVLDGRLPTANQSVLFFAGVRQGRPRACHVKVCP
jgi:cold shock CspA family protein